MLGPSIVSASVPMSLGYSIHSFRKSPDRMWAVGGLAAAALLALPMVWTVGMVLLDVLTGKYAG